jgi:hypothetical protein
MSKIINIIGTSEKYQINKALKIKKPKVILEPILKEREKIKDISLLLSEQNNHLQNLINHENNNITNLLEKQIKRKISSYKSQDINKKRYNEDKFISFQEVLLLMNEEEIKCYYCKCFMFVLYEFARENKQWSLDRIDNDLGHNKDNIVLSCLECNLKKRKIRKESFLFTKNLKIVQTI